MLQRPKVNEDLETGTLLKATFAGDLCVYRFLEDALQQHTATDMTYRNVDPLVILAEDTIVVLLDTFVDSYDKLFVRVIFPGGTGWMYSYGMELV